MNTVAQGSSAAQGHLLAAVSVPMVRLQWHPDHVLAEAGDENEEPFHGFLLQPGLFCTTAPPAPKGVR